MPLKSEPIHYDFIDGLRGIAILMVLAQHVLDHGLWYPLSHFPNPPFFLKLVLAAGKNGVCLFFTVSAFSVFLSHQKRVENEAETKLSFYLRRAFRILPLWVVAILIYNLTVEKSMDVVFAHLTFIFGFISFLPDMKIFDAQWSLFAEEVFYIFFPFLFYKIKNIVNATSFLVVSLLVGFTWVPLAGKLGFSNVNRFIEYFPLGYIYYFAFGILWALFYKDNLYLNKFMQSKLVGYSASIISLLLILTLNLENSFLSFVTIAFVFVSGFYSNTILGTVARARFIRLLGVQSYSIYLFHLFIIGHLEYYRHIFYRKQGLYSWGLGYQFLFWMFVNTVICFLLSYCVYRFFERPCIELGKKFIKLFSRKDLRVLTQVV